MPWRGDDICTKYTRDRTGIQDYIKNSDNPIIKRQISQSETNGQ